MQELLTRDEFRNGVFARDKHICVACKAAPAQDAHHIIERRLFEDGGYYLDNGASLCGFCHFKAEQTLISPDELREKAGITKIVLPPHLYPDYKYTKWGDIETEAGTRFPGELFYDESVQKILEAGKVLHRYLKYIKYPRTFHLPFSAGRTDDDRALENCSQFEGKDVVITYKMDGENTTGYWDGYIHARSLDSNNHPSRNWVKNYLAGKLCELPEGWRICGENLYAKHSIHYNRLDSFFLVFSIWNERNVCLSWEETKEWCKLLELQHVPVHSRGKWTKDIEIGLRAFGSQIDKGYRIDGDEVEGLVVRLADSFNYGDFRKSIAKFVRANHVQTNKHWIKTAIVRNAIKTN